MMKFSKSLVVALLITLGITASPNAQTQLVQDFSNLLSIPNIKTIEASTSHLYVLSDLEGMAVFRVYGDSLQWLYTSSGMQRRGNVIESDIRFAYLYGSTKRLTVLEPTSVLGVYSSTLLPEIPLGVARLENSLFVALGTAGLGMLSLETPETVDSEALIVANDVIGRADVLDVASSVISNQLFVVDGDERLHAFSMSDDGELEFVSTINLRQPIVHLFLDNEQVWGSTKTGEIFEINSNGLGRKVGEINEPVSTLISWNNNLLIRANSGAIWRSVNDGRLVPWKSDPTSGNFITESAETVWLSVFDKLSPITILSPETNPTTTNTTPANFRIKPISPITLTYPNPLILGLELEDGYPVEDVEFSYRSNATNAVIKKQGFFWQPGIDQVGYNSFTIIASNSAGEVDSTRFVVDVRTFNAPPRFSPVRGSTIVTNDPFELQFNAVDPESPSSRLIRYLGVDLPEGSNLNERTGLFTWTPSDRQVGEQTFRVVATDAQGAAASIDVTFKVIELSRDGE